MMKDNWKRMTLFLAILAIALIASTPLVHGQMDSKDFPGSMCVAAVTHNTDESIDDRYGYSTEGWLENYSTTIVLPVVCSVVEDCTRNYSTAHWFSVRDDSTTQDARCRIEIRTGTGGYYIGSYAYSSGASTSPRVFSITSPTDGPDYSYVIMYCELPPIDGARWRNVMVGYHVEENCS